jgi:hypothetical protein
MRTLSKIQQEQRDLEDIDIWGETCLTSLTSDGGQLLRGHQVLDWFGESFDWVAVTFEMTDPNGVMGPAKTLAFYQDGEGVDCAVVHATHFTTRRETKVGNTMLVQNSRLEFNRRGHPPPGAIRVDQINRGLLVFEHVNFKGPLLLRTNHMEEKSKFVVSCFKDWDDWAHLFCEWANVLPQAEIQSATPDMDDEADTDEESVSSDSSSEDNGKEGSSMGGHWC